MTSANDLFATNARTKNRSRKICERGSVKGAKRIKNDFF